PVAAADVPGDAVHEVEPSGAGARRAGGSVASARPLRFGWAKESEPFAAKEDEAASPVGEALAGLWLAKVYRRKRPGEEDNSPKVKTSTRRCLTGACPSALLSVVAGGLGGPCEVAQERDSPVARGLSNPSSGGIYRG